MSKQQFGDLYNQLKLPVIVCRRDADLSIAYMNGGARLTFAPIASQDESVHPPKLGEILRFKNGALFQAFSTGLRDAGFVDSLDAEVLSFQDESLPVRIYANSARMNGEEFFVVYFAELPAADSCTAQTALFTHILNVGNYLLDPEEAVRAILALAGEHAGVSRAYIYENNGDTALNTYEWAAPGIAPALEKIRNLNTKIRDKDTAVHASGLYITHDTETLPRRDREILIGQGIKSLAVVPLYRNNAPLGFIGFDECAEKRHWSLQDIQLLRNVAGVVTCLINRRDALRAAKRSHNIVQTVTDNLDDLVYISDLETHELKFISNSLARAVRKEPSEILGQPCWKVLHRGQEGPCSFCPIPQVYQRMEKGEEGSYVWELHNTLTGKWYMVKDSIVDWLDGEKAHLGTFVDITYRKQYEEQLKRFAATDAMTDVYNRKWGFGKLGDLFLARDIQGGCRQTLCFIDVDGLKSVNDRLGHAAGDEMIVNIVRTIFSCIRKDDFICRWGGDEFILFLNCGQTDARTVLDKINFGMEHFNSTRNKPYLLSVSTGLVDFSAPFESLDELIGEADRRMYANKMEKRGVARTLS